MEMQVHETHESPVQQGAVYLVGAGPGAVGMLTVRAVEVLISCDVVLHDRLVPPAIVQLAKPTAQVIYVGKDGGVSTEKMKGQQDDIGRQLVEFAGQGYSVCRLKGGDPMIYGRVGEEMEQLVEAGIPYEVVPAVTAALAAGADARIPLTFRNCATSLRVHTMNATTTRDEKFDWSQFSAPMTTYALYMGLSALEGACSRMMAAGMPSETPMAVVDRASLPEMQVVAGTVGTLPAITKDRRDLEGPAIVLLGDAVALRDKLSGSSPAPAAPAADAALAAAMAALPAVGSDGLRSLRDRIDKLLEHRQAAVAGDGSQGYADALAEKPPAKRAAIS